MFNRSADPFHYIEQPRTPPMAPMAPMAPMSPMMGVQQPAKIEDYETLSLAEQQVAKIEDHEPEDHEPLSLADLYRSALMDMQ